MNTYRVMWSEMWLRTADVEVDEDYLRETVKVPIGPLTERSIGDYLEDSENFGGDGWHPGSAPGALPHDEYVDLDVEHVWSTVGDDLPSKASPQAPLP